MTTLRPFKLTDCFRFNNINLDPLTETYNMPFYMQYLAKWPDYFLVAEAPGNVLTGYIMGKAEGRGTHWHGHVTALTVAPEFRRLGQSTLLMQFLEQRSEAYKTYFVDLYVRASNRVAVNMYKKFGYVIYRQVIGYYSDNNEDAYDMRRSMSRDPEKDAMIPLPHPVHPDALDLAG